MSMLQKLIMTILPSAWSAAIKAESQRWMLHCPSCGTVRSLWDIGGMRYKATPRKRKALIWCQTCRRTQWMEMDLQPLP